MLRGMRTWFLLVFGFSAFGCSPSTTPTAGADPLPIPARDLPRAADSEPTETVVLAGGCFWCVEAVFESLTGVQAVVSGYAGGSADDAKYDSVSAGRTRHAEAVRITYDPAMISYGTLLRVFFTAHDPTQLDRQGPDRGSQYRSAVFYANDDEKQVAADYITQLTESGLFRKPIVTRLEKLETFHPAEAYHQDFVRRNPDHGYVRAWVPQKLAKVKKSYPELVPAK